MIVSDGRKFLIETIRKEADLEIERLEKDASARLEEERKRIRQGMKDDKDRIDSDADRSIERLERQKTSNFELRQRNRLLARQNELIDTVIQNARNRISGSDPKTAKAIIKKMITRLEEESEETIREFHVPKGMKIEGRICIDDLDDFRVVADISDDAELEISLDDLIQERLSDIQKMISERTA